MSDTFYQELRRRREVEDKQRQDLWAEALAVEERCLAADAEIQEVQRAAQEAILTITTRVGQDRESASRLRRQAADLGLRVDSMDVLLMDAPEGPEPAPPAATATLSMAAWALDFLGRHPSSDFTLAQLVQAVEREGTVVVTKTDFRTRLRSALVDAVKAGRVLSRESARGTAWLIFKAQAPKSFSQ